MLKLLYKDLLRPTKTIRIHLLCWFIFILYELSLLEIISGSTRPAFHYVIYYLFNISLFYIHSQLVLPRITKKFIASLWLIPIFTILELAVYCGIAVVISCLIMLFTSEPIKIEYFNIKFFGITLWRGIYFILYASAYYIFLSYHRKRQAALTKTIENEQLQNELLRAEQDFLRAQINPHLLFNTLSFIKYAAKKKPEEANEAIMRLSSIMGFALENNSQTILVSKELEQVENIIKLNQLRFNHTLHINYITQLHNAQATIIPIIILTLVENTFKHGNLLDKDYPAEIRIESTAEYLTIQTSNLPNYDSNVQSSKTGLANITSRLDQFYKNNYKFTHEIAGNLFKAELVLKLKN
ncbi:sensor histidine kinase [Pedobacter cryoconitis]|uniref:Histidine kinase n=1 Tax=Pedobacter cryoconitis TaxID=188932 RepID=A0A327SKA4_9SPHI|nr:sensor histidine kinase [Pedobacter cryoconitis]RAJ29626.1 histidine kinase [Pedobacter cryoconitis]